MMNKRLLISIPVVLLSLWGFNYYRLSSIESEILKTSASDNTKIKVNWTRKVASTNRMEVELNAYDHNFIVHIKPAYFSKDLQFSIGQDAEALFSEQLEAEVHYSKITGTLKPNPTLLTLTVHDLDIPKFPITFDDEEPIHYKLSAKEETLTLWFESISDLFNQESRNQVQVLTVGLKDLNLNESLYLDKLLFDTTSSNPNETKYRVLINNMHNKDLKLLKPACTNMFSASDNVDLYCNDEVLNNSFPLNIDFYTAIDNSILLGKPENGNGNFRLLLTNPLMSYQMDGTITQTLKEIALKLRQQATMTDPEKTKALYDTVDPDNTFNHSLISGVSHLEVKTNPYSFNPIFAVYSAQTNYADDKEITTVQFKLDQTKQRYFLLDGEPQTEGFSKENTEHVGTIRIGHDLLVEFVSNLLGFEVEKGSIVEVYEDKATTTPEQP